MKKVAYTVALSLLMGGAIQAQEANKMAGKEHKVAKKMAHKAKGAKEEMKAEKAKMDTKMKKR